MHAHWLLLQVYVRLKGRKGAAAVTSKWLLLNYKEKLERWVDD
jgi:hypothetical protein